MSFPDPQAVRRVTIHLPERPPELSRCRIAIVSEDAELTAVCARVLREEGYEVEAAQHSGHALLACLEGKPMDLLIADLSMADGSGPGLARRMRRFSPGLKAVYIARPGTVCDTEAVLIRPFTREDLLQRLARLREAEPAPHPRAYF